MITKERKKISTDWDLIAYHCKMITTYCEEMVMSRLDYTGDIEFHLKEIELELKKGKK